MKRALPLAEQLRQQPPSPPPGGGRSARVSGPRGGNGRAAVRPSGEGVSQHGSPVGGEASRVFAGVAALWLASIVVPEKAQAACSVLSHHPCTPYVGSVFRHHPFTPYSCGVFSRPGCTPDVLLPLNQVPVLKVEGHVGPGELLDREHPVGRINELGPLLSKCLELPPEDEAQAGMQVSLKLAFKRDGQILADPRFTYMTHEAPEKVKAAYQAAALDMIKHCTPLPITDQFGGAIAGRPFVVAIKETRTLRAGDHPDNAAVPPGEPKP